MPAREHDDTGEVLRHGVVDLAGQAFPFARDPGSAVRLGEGLLRRLELLDEHAALVGQPGDPGDPEPERASAEDADRFDDDRAGEGVQAGCDLQADARRDADGDRDPDGGADALDLAPRHGEQDGLDERGARYDRGQREGDDHEQRHEGCCGAGLVVPTPAVRHVRQGEQPEGDEGRPA